MGTFFLKMYPQLTFDSKEYDHKTNKKITKHRGPRENNEWPYLDSPTVYTNRKVGDKIPISTNDWSWPSVNEIISLYRTRTQQ